MVKKIGLALGVLIPVLGMVFSKEGLSLNQEWLTLGLWILLNLILLQTALPMTQKMVRILGLKDLDFPKRNFYLYMLTNYLFILLLQVYFIQVYVKDLGGLAQVLDVRLLVMVLILYGVNLQYGRFGDITYQGKVKNIRFQDKKSLISGADRWGAYVGDYSKGLVLGIHVLPYETITRIQQKKDGQLQIQGKGQEDYAVQIDAPLVKEKLKDLLSKKRPKEALAGKIRI